MDGTLIGVIVGGLLGLLGTLGGQALANKSRQETMHQEAVLELAARVLSTAQKTWERKNVSLMTQTSTALNTPDNTAFFGDYDTWAACYQDLQLALDELSFLMRDINTESRHLLESLMPYWDEDIIGKNLLFVANNGEENYLEARKAFKERIRRFFKT